MLRQRAAGDLMPERAPRLLAMPGPVLAPFNAGTAKAAVTTVRQQRDLGAHFIKAALVTSEAFYAAQAEARRLGIPILGHLPLADPSQRPAELPIIVLRSRCNTGHCRRREAIMLLNSKGQLTIPAHLRAKYGLHAGDEIEVVEVGGTLHIVRAEGAESRGQRLVRRLRNTASGQDVAGMSTDQIMALLRGE